MNTELIQQLTGLTGIAAFIITVPVIALYFVYSGAPPAKNILLRNFLNLFILITMVAFLAGFSTLAAQTQDDTSWIATMMLLFGFAHVIVTFIAQSMESGVVLGKTKPIDPTLVGSGAEASIVMYGPVARILTAATLICLGALVLMTGIIWSWIAWLAFAVAGLHLSLVPTLFSGMDPSKFYSINGWGIPVAGGWYLITILSVSISLLV